MARGSWIRSPGAALLGAVILAIGLVPVLKSDYLHTLGIFIAIQGSVVLGLILLMGFAGQVSLGQAAFVGMGAYVSGILTVHFDWNPWPAMLVAAAATAVVAAGVGLLTLNLRTHYLALATLGIGVVAFILFTELPLTGGSSGLIGIPSLGLAGVKLNTDARFYYLAWAVFAVGLALAYNLVRSPLGRDLKAISDSELAVRSAGVRTPRVKLMIFILSATYASVAGSLMAHYMGFISPESFNIWISVRYLVMATVGGMGSIWGAVAGTIIVDGLVEVLRVVVPRLLGENKSALFESIAFGVLLILSLKYMPEGVMGWLLPHKDQRVKGQSGDGKDQAKKTAEAGGISA